MRRGHPEQAMGRRQHPELSLLAHTFDPYYKVSVLPTPDSVDWKRFDRLIRNNKLQWSGLDYALKEFGSHMPPAWRSHFSEVLDHQVRESKKLGPSVEQAKALLGDLPYAIVKTKRTFPYFTHDIDILVEDTEIVGDLVTKAGIQWEPIPRPSVQIEDSRWLDLEFYPRVLPGSIRVIDDALALRGRVFGDLGGVDTWIAAPHIEVVTLLADAVFRLYELKFGDMIYIYSISDGVDWGLLAEQARKYGWYRYFAHYVGGLNSYHRAIYGVPSPIEDYIDTQIPLQQEPPYVSGWGTTTRALASRGPKHLIKLPGYFSVRLKQNHPRLHALYVRFFQVPLTRIVLRYVYH
jgi:hypothetical protein